MHFSDDWRIVGAQEIALASSFTDGLASCQSLASSWSVVPAVRSQDSLPCLRTAILCSVSLVPPGHQPIFFPWECHTQSYHHICGCPWIVPGVVVFLFLCPPAQPQWSLPPSVSGYTSDTCGLEALCELEPFPSGSPQSPQHNAWHIAGTHQVSTECLLGAKH